MAVRMRLGDRVGHISGSGRGVGRAIALAFAAEGARLALSARTAAELEETARLVSERHGTEVITVIADVSDFSQVNNAIRRTVEHFGSLDVLVNNAGNIGPVGRVWDNDPAEWARTIAIHLMVVFYGCHGAVPMMLERGRGRIVNMSGVGGPNTTAYDAAKIAIVNFTENLALELADTPITVNAVSPAPFTPGCGRRHVIFPWPSVTRPLTSGACRCPPGRERPSSGPPKWPCFWGAMTAVSSQAA